MKHPFAITVFVGVALFAFLIAPIIAPRITGANINAGNSSSVRAAPSSTSAVVLTSASSSKRSKSTGSSSTSSTCMQTAVAVREDAVIRGNAHLFGAILSSGMDRRIAFDSAWFITDAEKRRAAVMAAWVAFHTKKEQAEMIWENDIDAAWQNFQAAAETCGFPDADADGILLDR